MRPILLALGALALLSGCADLGYYVRSARGQAEVLEKARPIGDVAADPATAPDVRARLEAVGRIRAFASGELGLPDGAGFRTYADLGRPYVVWNVYAAPELSLAPRQWCFPFAGCVTYRGYFSETEARGFAEMLAAAGDDVYVGGVAAYSTLGWFDDPVLNTFVRYPEPDLARLIFHELAHRVAYAKDDTVFNESFATAVELEGVRRWLAATGTDEGRAGVGETERRRADFHALIERCRTRLESLYASAVPEDEKRRGKAAIFAALRDGYAAAKTAWGGYGGYDAWFAQPLNNAHVASVTTYTRLVPAFEEVLERLGGDLPRLYEAARALAALPKAERVARLHGPWDGGRKRAVRRDHGPGDGTEVLPDEAGQGRAGRRGVQPPRPRQRTLATFCGQCQWATSFREDPNRGGTVETPDDPLSGRPVQWGGALAKPLAALDDLEGAAVPEGLPPVIDAHVHVFPDRLMEAVRRWFDEHGWPSRYRLTSEELIAFLLGRGVDHLVLLHYAHRPGMARELNGYVAGLCRENARVTGLATVFPGEDGAREILEEAFGLGLGGVKLHQHVQCFDPGGPEVWEVAEVCAAHGRPLVAHLGREPRSPAYKCDPHRMCAVEQTERLLRDVPRLRLCVPHLGADEFEAYARLAERFDNLWLDTTMMLSGFFPGLHPPPLTRYRPDRVMYGTDFCNLPHAWDRELLRLAAMDLSEEFLARVLGGNAREFFGLDA